MTRQIQMMNDQAMTEQNRWDPSLYQDKHAFVWQHGADLLDLLAPRAGESIVDLGCGTGQLPSQIGQRGANVIGIDRSPETITEARRNLPSLPFEVANAT